MVPPLLIFFSHARLQGSIFSPYCDSFWHKLKQYGKKILYTYVYHIVYYLRKCEALHEITDFVHEMLRVCAPLVCTLFIMDVAYIYIHKYLYTYIHRYLYVYILEQNLTHLFSQMQLLATAGVLPKRKCILVTREVSNPRHMKIFDFFLWTWFRNTNH